MASSENDIHADSKKGADIELQDSVDQQEKDDDLRLDTIEIKQTKDNAHEFFIKGGNNPRAQFPMKLAVLPVFLLLCGILLITLGLVAKVNHQGTSKVVCFLVFGGIITIPGLYYSFQLILACRAGSITERDEILADFPNA